MIKVNIPQQLRGGTVEHDAKTISGLLSKLDPRLNSRFVNIFVNDEDIRFLSGKDTELHDGDEVTFIPAIAGGSCLKPI